MRWWAGLSLALAGCAAPAKAPDPPPASSPPPAPAPPPPPEVTPPTVVAETVVTGARATRLSRLTGIARGLYDAYDNERPQPVTRGFAQTQFVQFATDRRERGVMTWVEASTTALHGAPDAAAPLEPCKTPLLDGEELTLPRGRAKLVRGDDHDELLVADGKGALRPARLPRGAARGACAGPDGTRVWIAWSSPEAPSDLWSVALRDGSARALRVEPRPGTGGLSDVKSGALDVEGGAVAAYLEPVTPTKRAALLVADAGRPLSAWDPLARLLADSGVGVLLVRTPTSAALGVAARRWSASAITIARTLPASTPSEAPLLVLVAPESTSVVASLAGGSTVIGIGDASREPLIAALSQTRTDVRWMIAAGGSPRLSVPAAWARAADAALGEP